MPSDSFSLRNSAGSYAPRRTSLKRAAGRRRSWLSNRTPACAPPWNEFVRTPSTIHQSPSCSATTRGARSRYFASSRSPHTSGGSTMWESDEISFSSVMRSPWSGWLSRLGPDGFHDRADPLAQQGGVEVDDAVRQQRVVDALLEEVTIRAGILEQLRGHD